VAGSYEDGEKPSGYIKSSNILTNWATMSYSIRNLTH